MKKTCWNCGKDVRTVPVPGVPGFTRLAKHMVGGHICAGYKMSLKISHAQQRRAVQDTPKK